jgi:hypothetical protein
MTLACSIRFQRPQRPRRDHIKLRPHRRRPNTLCLMTHRERFPHRLGAPSKVFDYYDAAGRLLMRVGRWTTPTVTRPSDR